MNPEEKRLVRNERSILYEILRARVSAEEDNEQFRRQIWAFIALIEHDTQRDVLTQSAFHIARSLILLGRPLRALDRIAPFILREPVHLEPAVGDGIGVDRL